MAENLDSVSVKYMNAGVVAQSSLMVPVHPLGVKPNGNALTASKSLRDHLGFFSILFDETILLLLEWLEAKSLVALGSSCRGLFAYCSSDQLWRELFILYATFSILCHHPTFIIST